MQIRKVNRPHHQYSQYRLILSDDDLSVLHTAIYEEVSKEYVDIIMGLETDEKDLTKMIDAEDVFSYKIRIKHNSIIFMYRIEYMAFSYFYSLSDFISEKFTLRDKSIKERLHKHVHPKCRLVRLGEQTSGSDSKQIKELDRLPISHRRSDPRRIGILLNDPPKQSKGRRQSSVWGDQWPNFGSIVKERSKIPQYKDEEDS